MPSFDEMGGELLLSFLTHIGEKNLKASHRDSSQPNPGCNEADVVRVDIVKNNEDVGSFYK